MPHFTDQLGRTIELDRLPQRIISLVPSQTELLHDLGLNEEVIGITKFCVHPPAWFHNKTRIGGTRNVRIASIHELQPDLIIANKEENDKAQIEELSRHYPVWVSDIGTLDDALQMIGSVGELTGKSQPAQSLVREIGDRFATLPQTPLTLPQVALSDQAATLPQVASGAGLPSPRTAYFIWRKPWMVAGGDTFIQDMLRRAGLTNVFADQTRYPTTELETLPSLKCDTVLLSSEPYPFGEKHIAEIKALLPQAFIRLVDGEIFSWYGSRLLRAPDYLRQLYPLCCIGRGG